MLVGILSACLCLKGKPQQPIPLSNMEEAANYSMEFDGSAVLILHHDSLIFENYHNGADSSMGSMIASATKGFWSIAAATMLQNGLISSYDEYVAQTITEWQDSSVHPGKTLIQVKHLLALSSGLSQDVDQIQGSDPEADNIYQYVVDSLDMTFVPGTNFQYGPSSYYAFGVFLDRKLQNAGINQNPLEYLDSILFDPIGLQYEDWLHDAYGNPFIPTGCSVTPRNWIKFGQFLLQEGRWNEMQLLDSLLFRDLLIPGGPNPRHGKFLWLNNQGGQGAYPFQIAPPDSEGGFIYFDGFPDIFAAMGAAKNRMYIIPSLKLVVLRQALTENFSFQDHEFLSLLLHDISVRIEAQSSQSLGTSLYPNPTHSHLTLELNSNSNQLLVELRDAKGRMIEEFLSSTKGLNQITFDVSGLSSGVYFIQIKDDERTETRRFIKCER
jgi:CubicO group peptidase (beta-lactamase class C family)